MRNTHQSAGHPWPRPEDIERALQRARRIRAECLRRGIVTLAAYVRGIVRHVVALLPRAAFYPTSAVHPK